MNGKPATVSILLVEDDEVEIKALRRGMKKLELRNPVHIARDGIVALNMLRGVQGETPVAKPFVVVMDLNMPRMSGLELLAAMRADSELHRTVVFVLTTSMAEEDVLRAYDFNVAGYLVKADVSTSFINALVMLDHYCRRVLLPC